MNQKQFEYLDAKSQTELQDLRNQFQQFKGLNIENQRPVIEKQGKTDLYLFTGSKVQATIEQVIESTNKDLLSSPSETLISLTLKLDKNTSLDFWSNLQNTQIEFDKINENMLDQETSKNTLTKYAKFLPWDLQLELYQFLIFDIDGCREFVGKIQFLENNKIGSSTE